MGIFREWVNSSLTIIEGQVSVEMKMLVDILFKRYGVGPVTAGYTVVTWAVDRLEKEIGTERAEKALSELNSLREKHGRSPAFRFPLVP